MTKKILIHLVVTVFFGMNMAGVVLAQGASNVSPAPTSTGYTNNYGAVGAIIPSCALQKDGALTAECTNLTIFLVVAINIGRYLFGIVGALAVATFVYGGVMIIISSGNPDKIKIGGGAVFGSCLGMAVAFGGYVLVQFLSSAFDLKDIYLLK